MIDAEDLEFMPIKQEWLHLNTAPRDRPFLAHSKTWSRPQFVRRVPSGEYVTVNAPRRKVIPEVWFDLPRYK